MIDTHCHVHDAEFDADRDAVIARARDAGVRAMVTVGEDLGNSALAISTAQRYGLRAAAGIHPHEAARAPHDIAGELKPLLVQPGVVALGEAGLDYYYDRSPREVQRRVFERQLAVARELGTTVIFHQRDAFDDFVGIMREHWTPEMRGVVHCFTGTVEQAHTYTAEFGLMLGIGGVVTFPKAQSVRDSVLATTVAPLVLETDCPYLAPVPKRGKRNEPAFVTHTAAYVSALLGMPLDDLIAATDRNASRLFGV